jgi:hypothetical protein
LTFGLTEDHTNNKIVLVSIHYRFEIITSSYRFVIII